VNQGEQGTATTAIAIMWLVLGGTQALGSVWGLLMWAGMVAMTLFPQAGPIPTGVRIFMLAFPIGAAAQCTLACLFFRGAIRLLHSEPRAPVELRTLSRYALGFYAAVGAAMVLVGVGVSSGVGSPEAVLSARLLFIGIPICVAIIAAIPPVVTLLALGHRDGEPAFPGAATSEGLP
jgi:hypothetical protein